MQFGKFMFSIDTAAYQTLNFSHEYSWVEMERIGGHPIQQWTGPKAGVISMAGVIFTHYIRGPMSYMRDPNDLQAARNSQNITDMLEQNRAANGQVDQSGIGRSLFRMDATPRQNWLYETVPKAIGAEYINVLRAIAKAGKPQRLVDGRGMFYGYWCLKSIKETQSVFLYDGTPKKQEFDLEFVKYGEDFAYRKPPVNAPVSASDKPKFVSPWDVSDITTDAPLGYSLTGETVTTEEVTNTVTTFSSDLGLSSLNSVDLGPSYGAFPTTTVELGTTMENGVIANELLEDLKESQDTNGSVNNRPSVIFDLNWETGKI